MNIGDYISTGILEAYVLGDLTEKERAEVDANLNRYPELREELRLIEGAQEALLLRIAVSPPAHIRGSLMNRLSNDEERSGTKVVSLVPTPANRWWQLATAASVSLAVIASYFALTYRGELARTKESLAELTEKNQQIASDYNVVNEKLDQIETTLRITDNPAYRRVIMNGTDAAKGSLASVYWNPASHDLYLSVQNLRQLSRDQQFQLWAIVDGQPVDAGVFDVVDGLIKMKNIASASAFAVTIEKRGGSVSPSLESMQVLGTI